MSFSLDWSIDQRSHLWPIWNTLKFFCKGLKCGMHGARNIQKFKPDLSTFSLREADLSFVNFSRTYLENWIGWIRNLPMQISRMLTSATQMAETLRRPGKSDQCDFAEGIIPKSQTSSCKIGPICFVWGKSGRQTPDSMRPLHRHLQEGFPGEYQNGQLKP